jgi:hypothetical protein
LSTQSQCVNAPEQKNLKQRLSKKEKGCPQQQQQQQELHLNMRISLSLFQHGCPVSYLPSCSVQLVSSSRQEAFPLLLLVWLEGVEAQ